MRVVTWLDRLTDDSNPWLSAVKMEERGELAKAILLYLDDATKCLSEDMVARAALGASCAADCLDRGGFREMARKLYSATGMLYWENADTLTGISIREALWSLQEAYESFMYAGDLDDAKRAQCLFVSIARRANPFIGGEETFRLSPLGESVSELVTRPCSEIDSTEVQKAIEGFLRLQENRRNKAKAIKRTPSVPDPECDYVEAQSFVSQLG